MKDLKVVVSDKSVDGIVIAGEFHPIDTVRFVRSEDAINGDLIIYVKVVAPENPHINAIVDDMIEQQNPDADTCQYCERDVANGDIYCDEICEQLDAEDCSDCGWEMDSDGNCGCPE